MVLKKVTLPHELVYTTGGQLATYEELSLPLFITGYLAVMETEMPALQPVMDKHLTDLMAYTEVYGWLTVRPCHAVWLQKVATGQAHCGDTEKKLDFRRGLMWHAGQQM